MFFYLRRSPGQGEETVVLLVGVGGETVFKPPMYSFLGCVKQKLCLERGVKSIKPCLNRGMKSKKSCLKRGVKNTKLCVKRGVKSKNFVSKWMCKAKSLS